MDTRVTSSLHYLNLYRTSEKNKNKNYLLQLIEANIVSIIPHKYFF